jgi:hypothetical protein
MLVDHIGNDSFLMEALLGFVVAGRACADRLKYLTS